MRLGIFGGTFDPVHYGHLLLAECCREQAQLDEVWFVPAAIAPHKSDRPPTPPAARVEMLELAIGGNEQFSLCLIEVEHKGVNFTVDTLKEIKAAQPESELFFLMGADSLVDLPTWRDPEGICELATPLVVARPGSAAPDFDCLKEIVSPERLAVMRDSVVEMPLMGISSTEIRTRAARGQSIRYRTPAAVATYIENAELYRDSLSPA